MKFLYKNNILAESTFLRIPCIVVGNKKDQMSF